MPVVTAPLDPPSIMFTTADTRIGQSSGLTVAGSRIFTLGDAGSGLDQVWGLDGTGKAAVTINLPAGSNEDWEDIAAVKDRDGRRRIYLADTGDAHNVRSRQGLPSRREFRVIRFDEPDPARTGTVAATGVAVQRLKYPDEVTHNVEAMLVQPGTGKVFLVNKTEKAEQKTTLWAAPAFSPNQVGTLTAVVPEIPVFRATGAAFSLSGDRLVIRNEQTAYLWKVVKGDVAKAFENAPTEIPLPDQRQGEGVAFSADGRALLISSEGAKQPVWRVPLVSTPGKATASPAAEETGPRSTASSAVDGSETAADLRILAFTAVAALAGIGYLVFWYRRRR
ncbi:hypothetical protein [Rhizohabitans arisaemae]|uniref:hypothetical protein n=1 Tax=Rhizohabitans arisaemae TaxID=2720610 RepID=UPI0024B16D91|nr:hypothetical protein [Rhizohabitans arisaemae]